MTGEEFQPRGLKKMIREDRKPVVEGEQKGQKQRPEMMGCGFGRKRKEIGKSGLQSSYKRAIKELEMKLSDIKDPKKRERIRKRIDFLKSITLKQ